MVKISNVFLFGMAASASAFAPSPTFSPRQTAVLRMSDDDVGGKLVRSIQVEDKGVLELFLVGHPAGLKTSGCGCAHRIALVT